MGPGLAQLYQPYLSFSRTMATLYRDPDWSSKNLESAVFEARRHAIKDKMPALFPDSLRKFQEELRQRSQEGYKVNFTDFWGLLIEACLGDEVGPSFPWATRCPGWCPALFLHQGVWTCLAAGGS